LVVFAVIEVNNHPLKLNRPVLDPELKGSETLPTVHGDAIVIIPAVYMRLPEHFPSIVVIPTSLVVVVSAHAALSQEVYIRARAQTPPRIPELYAPDSTTITGEIDRTGSTLIGDSISNLKCVVGAVVEVDNHSIELDCPADDLEKEGSETLVVVDGNRIVIPPSVDISSPELLPSAIVSSTPLIVSTPLLV